MSKQELKGLQMKEQIDMMEFMLTANQERQHLPEVLLVFSVKLLLLFIKVLTYLRTRIIILTVHRQDIRTKTTLSQSRTGLMFWETK